MTCWLQEQLEQNTREKDEMQKELNHLMEENETLKSALEREGQECASLKVRSRDSTRTLSTAHRDRKPLPELWYQRVSPQQMQKEQNEREKAQLVEELGQTKQENESLKSSLEQRLKELEHLQVCGPDENIFFIVKMEILSLLWFIFSLIKLLLFPIIIKCKW